MAKAIITDEYFIELEEKINPLASGLRNLFLEEDKSYFENNRFLNDQLNEKILSEIGEVISVSSAWEKMTNFSPTPDRYKKIVPVGIINNFKSNLMRLNPPAGFELGLRVHMGYDSSGSGPNYFIMPAWISNRGHGYDKEQNIFSASVSFFGIDTDDTTELIHDYSGKQRVSKKDSSGITAVIFTLNTLENFLKGYNSSELAFVEFLAARESTGQYGRLTLTIRGTDTNSTILISKGKSTGYYFDQGDLIPPPPVNDTDF